MGRPTRQGTTRGGAGRRRRASAAGRRRVRRATALTLAVVAVLTTVAAGTAAGGVPAERAATGPAGVTEPAGGHPGVAGPFASQDGGTGVGGGLVICDREAGEFVGAFNDGTESVPAFLRGRISDSEVHLNVEGDGGGNYTMVTDEDSQVTDTSEGEPGSPSVRVITDCRTFRNITDATDPGERFRTAYENDRVEIVGVGATDWVAFTLADAATEPAELVVLLLVLLALVLLALVVAYVFARRLGAYYRGDDEDEDGGGVDEGTADAGEAGVTPEDGGPR